MAVLLLAILHFVTDDEVAHGMTRVFRDAMSSGSYIACSHGTHANLTPDARARLEATYARSTTPVRLRSREEVEAFFAGLQLVEPGLVYAPLWRPEGPDDLFLDEPGRSANWVGVGRKP